MMAIKDDPVQVEDQANVELNCCFIEVGLWVNKLNYTKSSF